MKRYGNLFERVVEYGNLEQAFHNAARHKTRRSEVIEYGSHLEANLLQLQRELITGTYRTSEYKTFTSLKSGRYSNCHSVIVSFIGLSCR